MTYCVPGLQSDKFFTTLPRGEQNTNSFNVKAALD